MRTISIFCSFSAFEVDEQYPAPLVYRESHILPSPDDPRGGSLDLGYIPGFITSDGRDRLGETGDEDEGVWPYLRFSLRPVQPPGEERRLRRKARAYRIAYRWRRRLHLGLPRWVWPEDTVILDRDQVAALRDELDGWLLRCDDLGAWMDLRDRFGAGRTP